MPGGNADGGLSHCSCLVQLSFREEEDVAIFLNEDFHEGLIRVRHMPSPTSLVSVEMSKVRCRRITTKKIGGRVYEDVTKANEVAVKQPRILVYNQVLLPASVLSPLDQSFQRKKVPNPLRRCIVASVTRLIEISDPVRETTTEKPFDFGNPPPIRGRTQRGA